jgi:hypothetical protein
VVEVDALGYCKYLQVWEPTFILPQRLRKTLRQSKVGWVTGGGAGRDGTTELAESQMIPVQNQLQLISDREAIPLYRFKQLP